MKNTIGFFMAQIEALYPFFLLHTLSTTFVLSTNTAHLYKSMFWPSNAFYYLQLYNRGDYLIVPISALHLFYLY